MIQTLGNHVWAVTYGSQFEMKEKTIHIGEKSHVARPGALASVLIPMTTRLAGGMLAEFVTEVGGEAEATVAAWEFEAIGNNGAALGSIDTGRAVYKGETTGDNVIAPGTQGSFDIVLDGAGSDVGIDYIVTVDKSSEPDTPDLPDDLVFQVDSTDYSLGNEIGGKVEHVAGDSAMKRTITVSRKWDYGGADTVEADKNDNKYAGESWKLKIKATGTQIKPTETTALTA